MSSLARGSRLTVPQFAARKATGPKLVLLTAYDFWTARRFAAAGVDALLVGDSVGTVVQGHDTTLPVTLEQMEYHTGMVARGAGDALVIADLPFLTYQTGVADAIRHAGRLIRAGAQAVKLEGGADHGPTVTALSKAGIPVLGHVGLMPQAIAALGRYRVERDGDRVLGDARAVAAAGAFGLVVEAVPTAVAAAVTAAVPVPTIGIGAGPGCDGQILVWQDALGLTIGHVPKFVRPFAQLGEAADAGVRAYRDAVRDGTFPGLENSYQ